MPKAANTPASVLKTFMDEYQLNPFSLSKAINLSPAGARLLVAGKSKVSVPTAMRLAKLFGQTPAYWLDLQREADLSEAAKDKVLQEIIKGISKAKKPVAPKSKSAPPAKTTQKTAVSKMRKTAAEAPAEKPVMGRRSKGNVTTEKE